MALYNPSNAPKHIMRDYVNPSTNVSSGRVSQSYYQGRTQSTAEAARRRAAEDARRQADAQRARAAAQMREHTAMQQAAARAAAAQRAAQQRAAQQRAAQEAAARRQAELIRQQQIQMREQTSQQAGYAQQQMAAQEAARQRSQQEAAQNASRYQGPQGPPSFAQNTGEPSMPWGYSGESFWDRQIESANNPAQAEFYESQRDKWTQWAQSKDRRVQGVKDYFNQFGPMVQEGTQLLGEGAGMFGRAVGEGLYQGMQPIADVAQNMFRRPLSGDYLHQLMSADPLAWLRNFRGQEEFDSTPGGPNRPGYFMGGQYGGFRPGYVGEPPPSTSSMPDWLRSYVNSPGNPPTPLPPGVNPNDPFGYQDVYDRYGGIGRRSDQAKELPSNAAWGEKYDDRPMGQVGYVPKGDYGGGGWSYPFYGGGYNYPRYEYPEQAQNWYEKMLQWRI